MAKKLTRKQAIHQGLMIDAKKDLLKAISAESKEQKRLGYDVVITPAVRRLLDAPQYRARDVEKMQKLATHADQLRDYLLITDSRTGELVSGGDALARYERLAALHEPKAPVVTDIMRQRIKETIDEAFVDLSVYEEFVNTLNSLLAGDVNAVDESTFSALHPSIKDNQRGSAEYFLNENMADLEEIRRLLDRALSTLDMREVARRMNERPEVLNDLQSVAFSYKHAQRGMQSLVQLLWPGMPADGVRKLGAIMEEQDYYGSEYDSED